jgi:hypothetical protein
LNEEPSEDAAARMKHRRQLPPSTHFFEVASFEVVFFEAASFELCCLSRRRPLRMEKASKEASSKNETSKEASSNFEGGDVWIISCPLDN